LSGLCGYELQAAADPHVGAGSGGQELASAKTRTEPVTSSPSQNGTSVAGEQPHLKRLLTVTDLVFFGIVLIQPIAPVGIFGIASEKSHGHVSATI
jgi:hypothetical protein